MEIKPSWLLEGQSTLALGAIHALVSLCITVAPHYFKEADLEQLATGEKKMPKVIGTASSTVTQS
jgi:pre-mRNA-splicing factor ATP-dependent RNA helicase DHX16